jgi:ribonuclease HI
MTSVATHTDGAQGKPDPAAGVRFSCRVRASADSAEAHTTNNRMELTVAIRALASLRGCAVEIHTDSNTSRTASRRGSTPEATVKRRPIRSPSRMRSCGNWMRCVYSTR